MKAYTGPYRSWIGPYQIADLLQYVGVSDDRCHAIGGWLSNTWVRGVLEKIHNTKKRKVNIRIDDYDVWGADTTLAMVAAPMLVKLIAAKQGAPFTDDADVPEHLRSTACVPKENEWDTDDNHFLRWEWVVNEMLFAMIEISGNEPGESQFFDHSEVDETKSINTQIGQIRVDREGLDAYRKRVQNGCVLFGKYFQNLWD